MSIIATTKSFKIGKLDKELGTVEVQAFVNLENNTGKNIRRVTYTVVFRNDKGVAIGMTSGDTLNIDLKNKAKAVVDVSGFIMDSALGDRKKGHFEIHIKSYEIITISLAKFDAPTPQNEPKYTLIKADKDSQQLEISYANFMAKAYEKNHNRYESSAVVYNNSASSFEFVRLIQRLSTPEEEIESDWCEEPINTKSVKLYNFNPIEIPKKSSEKVKFELDLEIYSLVENSLVKEDI